MEALQPLQAVALATEPLTQGLAGVSTAVSDIGKRCYTGTSTTLMKM